jgi:hypothetical protein
MIVLSVFNWRVLRSVGLPNNACTRLGVRAAFYEHFPGFELFPVSTVTPPSHPKRVTPAVRRILFVPQNGF